MSDFPLRIGDCSVINISPGGGSTHPLYVMSKSRNVVKVFNIPLLYNKASLYSFFSTFGPILQFSYNKAGCCADIQYRINASVDALISTPMTVSYNLPVQKATFSQIIADSKKSWLRDPDALKKESEEALQEYFREKLAESDDSEEESDGWTSVKPRKRRVR